MANNKPQDNESRESFIVMPDSLLRCKKLTPIEKMAMGDILSFTENGYYESPQKMAERLDISLSAVEHIRSKFIKLGYLEKVEFKNGRTHYRVREDIIERDCQVHRITKKDVFSCQEKPQNLQPKTAKLTDLQNHTYIYDNKEDNKDITPLNPPMGGCVAQKDKNDEKDEVDNIFNLWLSCFGLSERKLTQGRVVKIKRRLKDCGKEQLELAIRNASQDYFYRGDNDRGWQADIDYICRSVEIVERLANMTPRGERPMTWWEEKQQRELEQCAPRYGESTRGYTVVEEDDDLVVIDYNSDPEPKPTPEKTDKPDQDEAPAPLDMDELRKRFLEGKARAIKRRNEALSDGEARAKVGL